MKAYNLKKLKVEKDTFEDKRADLIISVPFKAFPKRKLELLILLEHKSYYDKWLFDQLLDYLVLIRKYCIRKKGYPQPVIAVLFYHGKQPMKWGKTLQDEDFKSFFSKIPIESRKDMLNYGLRIINVREPRVQKVYKSKGFRGRGVIKLLSEIWGIRKPSASKVRDIVGEFKSVFAELRGVRKQDTILRIAEYLFDNTGLDFETWSKAEDLMVEDNILTKGGVMDIREHLKEKGRWEGRQEERKQVVLNMLKKRRICLLFLK